MRRLCRVALVSGVLSGAPSTAWALVRGGDPLEATRAAGRLVLPDATRGPRLIAAAAVVHAALTLGWVAVLGRLLPGRGERASARGGSRAGSGVSAREGACPGALAGAGIAALDLGLAHALPDHPRLRAVARLAVGPQLADHVAFGAITGWQLAGTA